ncbi:MAG: ATP-binding protein [Solirubrobacterales bacterium]
MIKHKESMERRKGRNDTIRRRVYTAIGLTSVIALVLFGLLLMTMLATQVKQIGWSIGYMVSNSMAQEISAPEFLGEMHIDCLQAFNPDEETAQLWLLQLNERIGQDMLLQDILSQKWKNWVQKTGHDPAGPVLPAPGRLPPGPGMGLKRGTGGSPDSPTVSPEVNSALKTVQNQGLILPSRMPIVELVITLNGHEVFNNMSDSTRDFRKQTEIIRAKKAAERTMGERLTLWVHDGFYTRVTTDIPDQDGKIAGTATAGLNPDIVSVILGVVALIVLGAAILVFMISLLIGRIMVFPVLAPLSRLQAEMSAMASGDARSILDQPERTQRYPEEVENLLEARDAILGRIKEFTDLQEKQTHILEQQKQDLEKMAASLAANNRQLTEANASLEAEIAVRLQTEQALQLSKEAADAANRAKSEFLANMSHEIRTPMNAVLGFTDLLEQAVQGETERGYLETIRSSGRNLMSLLNDILDLSKIEAGRMEIRYGPTDIPALLNEVKQVFTFKAIEKRLELTVEADPDIPESLLLDEARLRQILVNLVGNAMKFTDQGTVRLSARSVRREIGKLDLVFRVEDTGIGIDPDSLERVFEAFVQQQGQSTRKYGGTGLGLAISRRLTEMMDGEIRVESEPGKGSIFTVVLHNVMVSDMIPVKLRDELEQIRRLRFAPAAVLVVDDLPENRILIREYLAGTGLTVIEASDGLEAVLAAERECPAVILMDLRMPNLNGFEALARIRENPQLAPIPVIAVTASVMRQDQNQIELAGFQGLLEKPTQKIELFNTVKRFLEYRISEEAEEFARHDGGEVGGVSGDEALIPADTGPLAALLDNLEREYLPALDVLKNSGLFEDYETFAVGLAQLAGEYELDPLKAFAKTMAAHVDSFDVESIRGDLNAFPALVAKLRAWVQKG